MFFKLPILYSKIIILLFLVCLSKIIVSLNSVSFRIIAPQTICKQKNLKNSFTNVTNLDQNISIYNNEKEQIDNQAIAISFQPRNGIKLRYKVQIFFKTLDTIQNRSQRRTLMIWKSIRALEKRINTKDSNLISELDILSINKNELINGVSYFFQVVGLTGTGLQTTTKNFSIKFTGNGKLLRLNDKAEGVNLALLGVEESKVSIPYIVVASVEFCNSSFHDYHFQWDLVKPSNIDEIVKTYLHRSSNILILPEYALQSNTDYRLSVEVIDSNDSELLAKDFIDFVLTEQDFSVTIIPTSILTGIKNSVSFEIQVENYDVDKYLTEINWNCYQSENICNNITSDALVLRNSNYTRNEISFQLPGDYEILVNVMINSKTKTVRSNVTIVSDVSINYEFLRLPSLLIPVNRILEINLHVTGLIPGCIGNWTNLVDEENGFGSIDPSMNHLLGNFYIKDIYSEFLSEIDDITNKTSSYDVTLNIPHLKQRNQTNDQIDLKYKFRLIVNCTYEIDSEKNVHVMMSFFELIIIANSQPKGAPLNVNPLNGTALATVFQLTTGSAKHRDNDFPLLYEYFIEVDNNQINLGSYYETFVISTILPYSENEIKTFYRVCDTRKSCSLIQGPNVNVSLVESVFNQEAIKNRENEINYLFQRMSFNDAENLISMCILTYKAYNETIYENFTKYSTELLSQMITKLGEQPEMEYFLFKEEIVQFVNLTKNNFKMMNIESAELMRKLIDLLQATSNDIPVSNIKPSDLKKRNITTDRKKRDLITEKIGVEDRSIVDTSFFEIALKLMEKFLNSVNETKLHMEKLQIIAKVSLLTEKLCGNEKFFREIFYTSFIGITVEKMSGFQLFGKMFTIPKHYSSQQAYFTINTLDMGVNRKKYYCLILMQFPEDYFSVNNVVKNIVYNIELYELIGQKQQTKKCNIGNENNNILELEINDDFHKLTSCVMWQSNLWSSENCVRKMNKNQVKCSCNKLGYYKILNLNESIPETTTIQPIEITSLLTENQTENTVTATNLINDNDLVLSSQIPTTQIHADNKFHFNTKLNIFTTVKSIITAISTESTSSITLKSKNNNKSSLNSTLSTTASIHEERVSTASSKTVNYYILGSVAFIGLIGSLVIIYCIYYRRKQKPQKILNELEFIPGTREYTNGIGYATFYDEHLLKGEIPN